MRIMLSVIGVLLFLSAFGQKQFKNMLSLSVGTEYFNEKEMLLTDYSIFTSNPMYGVQIGFERKWGKYISIQPSLSVFNGFYKEDVEISNDQGENFRTVDLQNTYLRWNAQLAIYFWVVKSKKYTLCPGLAFTYGSTIMHSYIIKDSDFKKRSWVNHQYANVALQLTNRFTLKRLRSTNKGTYGELQLLVTPYAAANVYKNLDWKAAITEPSHETLFGGGILLGLGFLF